MKYTAINKPILIVGYGNILRQDDGVGHKAAHLVRNRLPGNSVEILCVHQLLPELAETISRADLAVFIDADARLSPGEISKVTITLTQKTGGVIEHHQTPQALLQLASDLYSRCPHAILYSIGGADFSFGPALSFQADHGAHRVADDIVQTVTDFSHGVCHA